MGKNIFFKIKNYFLKNSAKKIKAESLKAEFIPNCTSIMRILEPRIMFDGAMADTIDEALDIDSSFEDIGADSNPEDFLQDEQISLFDNFSPQLSESLENNTLIKEIAFVDIFVKDYQTLIDKLPNHIEIFFIDPSQDGVEQIAEIISNSDRKGNTYDAVHIISHGSSGELFIGMSNLNADTMQNQYSDELATISSSLNENADILIYGCNFGKGSEGENAVKILGKLAGADIAASDDLTGAKDKGGDWELEITYGDVTAINALFP